MITELLLQMGFDERTVKVTPYNNDGGIDVVGVYRAAGLTEVNAAVQVKRWKRNIQAPTGGDCRMAAKSGGNGWWVA